MHLRHLFSSRLRGSLLLGSLLVASSFSTQAAEADAIRFLAGAGHPLAEQLGLAVGVDRQHRDDVLRHHKIGRAHV